MKISCSWCCRDRPTKPRAGTANLWGNEWLCDECAEKDEGAGITPPPPIHTSQGGASNIPHLDPHKSASYWRAMYEDQLRRKRLLHERYEDLHTKHKLLRAESQGWEGEAGWYHHQLEEIANVLGAGDCKENTCEGCSYEIWEAGRIARAALNTAGSPADLLAAQYLWALQQLLSAYTAENGQIRGDS